MSLAFVSAIDAEALARVHAASFETPWPARDIAILLEDPGGLALSAGDEDIHGFILIRANSYEAEILTLAVDPAFRRRGLARMLVEAVVGLAETQGAEALFLEVAEDNPAAIALYAGLGFDQVGRRRAYYARKGRESVDALVMRRVLNRRPG